MNNHTIVIPQTTTFILASLSIGNGDYLGVFYDSCGIERCAGFSLYDNSANIPVTAWGNDEYTPGFKQNEVFKWRIWKWESKKQYSLNATYVSSLFSTGDSTYQENGISQIASFSIIPVYVDAGINVNICDGDTLFIDSEVRSINGVSLEYLNPQTNIFEGFNPNVGIIPDSSFVFFLRAIDSNGNLHIDSMEVTIRSNPLPNLGNDSIVLIGNPIGLNPGVFTSYLWNSGYEAQVFTVNEAGTYSVTVGNAYGCLGVDSVIYDSPGWVVAGTDNNHQIFFPDTFSLSNYPTILTTGDVLSVFYDSAGVLRCAGQSIYQDGIAFSLTAWGESVLGEGGFITSEAFKWKLWDRESRNVYSLLPEYSQTSMFADTSYQVNGMSLLISAAIPEIFADFDNNLLDYSALSPLLVDSISLALGSIPCENVDPTNIIFEAYVTGGSIYDCGAIIIISDTSAPVALCRNLDIYLDSTGVANLMPIDIDNDSWDYCGISEFVLSKSEFDCIDLGVNEVVMSVSDYHANMATCTSMVTVLDSIELSLVCPNDIEVWTCFEEEFVSPGAPIVFDNCDFGTISNSFTSMLSADTIYPLGTTYISWSVSDATGNQYSCIQEVEVHQYELPQINFPQDTIITMQPDTVVLSAGQFDTYLWSTGATDSLIEVLDYGVYIVTVSLYSCFATDSIVIIGGQIAVGQNIVMLQGWSIFSTYMEPINPGIDIVVAPIIQNVLLIKNWNGMVYWPQFGINLIGNMVPGQGYLIKILNTDTLKIEGTIIQPEITPIPIPISWSILGYLRTTPAPLTTMLSPIVVNMGLVKNYLGQVYWPQFSVNLIGDMIPGQGYLLKMLAPDTLTFPANNIPFTKSRINIPQPNYYRHFYNSDNNMTLGIPLSAWKTIPEFGDEIGVFDESGQLTGSGVFIGENMAIAIWGDDKMTDLKEGCINDEKFSIRLWSSEKVNKELIIVTSWLEGDNSYSSNKVAIANKVKVQGISISDRIILYQNQPNPCANETEFSFYLPEKRHVEFTILNLLGEIIETLHSEKMESGKHILKYQTNHLAPGNYYYKLKTPDYLETRKMIIAR
jgi:hypothetical protein